MSQFWDNFISTTSNYNIKRTATKWYVKHAEAYIKTNKAKRLAEHTAENIEEYLKSKGRNLRLEDWQFVQRV